MAASSSSSPARPPPPQSIQNQQQNQNQNQQQRAMRKKKNGDVSLYTRFQIVLLVATITIWYMISMTEYAISSTQQQQQQHGQHGAASSFFNPPSSLSNNDDCSTTKGGRGSLSNSYTSYNNPSRKQLLRQIHSTEELTQPYHTLTIAIDSRHSCPDLCVFVHPLLPSWVRYRQLHFDSEIDLAYKLKEDHGPVIVVARTNIINIANWAVERRTKYAAATNNSTSSSTSSSSGVSVVPGPSTGLFHNADERFHKGEIAGVYDKFDYVLRQYYRKDEDGKFHGYHLHALGNYTCGTRQQSLPIPTVTPMQSGAQTGVAAAAIAMQTTSTTQYSGPKWGVHYVPLNAHTVDIQLLHHATSNYPTSLRPANCSFIGRSDVKRSKHERSTMAQSVQKFGSELNCTVTFTGSFAGGNTKFEYFNYDISQSKIGLSPRGSAIETHRLAELLRMGSVPAIVSEDYLYATFRKVPGIIGSDWEGVVREMKGYLKEEREVFEENAMIDRNGGGGGDGGERGSVKKKKKISKLEMLSREGTKFYRDLEACMMADMDFILKGAFGLSS